MPDDSIWCPVEGLEVIWTDGTDDYGSKVTAFNPRTGNGWPLNEIQNYLRQFETQVATDLAGTQRRVQGQIHNLSQGIAGTETP